MQPQATDYDLVEYPGYTHVQTHPDRSAVIGALMGLEPAPVERCRVLELGCGNGFNLAPMAWGLPGSQFVGVDLAARPVAEGQQMIKDLGLTNITLRRADILELGDNEGRFDYIIAHGVYSWVPAEVQRGLLAACRRLLAPQGVAFVSYNAFPGCHLRNMAREMMRFHVRNFQSADERVRQALALARFVADAQHTKDEARLCLKSEFEHILDHEKGHLFHDELADLNEPLYFTQFMERATAHGLQYLAEADYFEMFDYGLGEPTRRTLEQLGSNRILREQYLDFLKCRRFRQTLLCHGEARLQTEPRAEKVAGFLISSAAQCQTNPADLRPGVNSAYATPKGARCQTDLAIGKAALELLGKIWPMPLPFEVLCAQSQNLLRESGVSAETDLCADALPGFFCRLYAAGVVEFRAAMPPVTQSLSERPLTSPVIRWQVQRGEFITSLFHAAVRIEDEIGRSLLSWLDGTHDRAMLLERFWSMLLSKKALIIPAGNEAAARGDVKLNLEKNLQKLARLGLLMG